ncbi:MAG: PIN domain-containing protein [Bacteroidota bacterium]|nr:PIN domain-containing protein [Bacteroidota bacterium]
MASKVFIDANILLDFTLKRSNYLHAKKIFELSVNGRIQAFITSSVLHISGYWLTKSYGSFKAKELLLTLLIHVKVIDITHQTALTALHSKMNDIEDALQYYSAIHHRLDYFISEDKNLKKESIPILPVHTAAEFIKEYV